MKTESEYGYEFAEYNDATELVTLNDCINQTYSIPTEDYWTMKRTGIKNPSPVAYWDGYNRYVAEHI